MKVIAKLAGGSHLYGLSTPASDYDERYVYLLDNTADIIGLSKNAFIDHRNPDEDSFGYELRNFLVSLKKTNTQAMEILLATDDVFIELHPLFKNVRQQALNLIDPVQYYKSLRGYIQGESKLANGERTGKLGGKRKEALDKYGFSPKNFVQLLRLAYCGVIFYKEGIFPINISRHNKKLGAHLLDIKLNPEKFKKEDLNKEVADADELLKVIYEECGARSSYSYNDAIANDLIMDAYYPMLGKLQAERLGL